MIANNLDWTGPQSVLEFLRDVGKHFSVNVMLARETVKRRLAAEGISYTEFSYLLLQSQDYLHLYRREGCRLQIGGSDQWGNIVGGVDLIRRVEGATVHALTVPLITDSEGRKFGKSTGGGQHLAGPADDVAVRLVPVLRQRRRCRRRAATCGCSPSCPSRRSRHLEKDVAERPHLRAAQRRLAAELTTLVHGSHQTAQVIAASQALFGRADLRELDDATVETALAEVPVATVTSRDHRPSSICWWPPA